MEPNAAQPPSAILAPPVFYFARSFNALQTVFLQTGCNHTLVWSQKLSRPGAKPGRETPSRDTEALGATPQAGVRPHSGRPCRSRLKGPPASGRRPQLCTSLALALQPDPRRHAQTQRGLKGSASRDTQTERHTRHFIEMPTLY